MQIPHVLSKHLRWFLICQQIQSSSLVTTWHCTDSFIFQILCVTDIKDRVCLIIFIMRGVALVRTLIRESHNTFDICARHSLPSFRIISIILILIKPINTFPNLENDKWVKHKKPWIFHSTEICKQVWITRFIHILHVLYTSLAKLQIKSCWKWQISFAYFQKKQDRNLSDDALV